MDDDLECNFCEAWCCDTDDELIAFCDICNAVVCFDCQAICLAPLNSLMQVCSKCETEQTFETH